MVYSMQMFVGFVVVFAVVLFVVVLVLGVVVVLVILVLWVVVGEHLFGSVYHLRLIKIIRL
jgi:hypothetical protein